MASVWFTGQAAQFTPGRQTESGMRNRWRAVTYVTDASGRDEVYVQPYPGPGERVVISTNGGRQPVWSRDGSELFYRNGNQLMVVSIRTEPEFRAGVPELLFEGRFVSDPPLSGSQTYDVSPDGKRFLMVQSSERTNELHVVLNWQEELKRVCRDQG